MKRCVPNICEISHFIKIIFLKSENVENFLVPSLSFAAILADQHPFFVSYEAIVECDLNIYAVNSVDNSKFSNELKEKTF